MSGGMTDRYMEQLIKDSYEEEEMAEEKPSDGNDADRQGELAENLSRISKALIELCVVKDKIYGSSYCKRGEKYGIFPNVARKFDRLENLVTSEIPAGDEAKATTIADLMMYCALWLNYLRENKPEEFSSLLKELEGWGIEW